VLNGDLTVKRLIRTVTGLALKAEHPDYPPIAITADADCAIW
ncbi:MAG: peptidase S24, partial [Rhodospirillaceae bacterium]|nr:peptidase S24 [Rhodospirillaceae bacterium]